ncbi:Gfo/Idh/MocA family oxidoreductase [uncultured Solobacterium sp.]|jgi:possible trans-1,2-dihydrobenzene-1,2-diol dehydrogenase|uniref:Gfo/Idh/MocA family protein n=1 Tax=uncultured Solobacterium sp. TaxID=747375 RepID=UPI002604107F|nr:Gfo/Idh/MocA family oxidoreductase [uncultured Solobacterium sp.]
MIRWGIIGAGKIAQRFVKSLAHESNSELYAVSCRTLSKAQQFADTYHAQKAYGSYVELLQDPNVDAVYITLPHGYHYIWSIKAIKAGKAVLVEKPAGINAFEIEGIMEVLKQYPVLWMEAMKPRFTPLYQKIHKLIEEGTIGDIQEIHTVLNSKQPQEVIKNSYLSNPVYGGALLDCGCYCATWIIEYTKGKLRIDRIDVDLEDGYDLHTKVQMHIGNTLVTLETAINQPEKKEVLMKGTKGEICISDLHRPTSAELKTEDKVEIIDCPYEIDDFYGEISHFVNLLQSGEKNSSIMSIQTSLETAMLLDRIKDAMTPNPIEI